MSDFMAKARLIARQRGISFSAACQVLGRASGRARRAQAASARKQADRPEKADWYRRWEAAQERQDNQD